MDCRRFRNMCRFQSGVSSICNWLGICVWSPFVTSSFINTTWCKSIGGTGGSSRLHGFWSRIVKRALTHLPSPGVRFHCNINYDPFLYLEDHDKIYGMSFLLRVSLLIRFEGFTITMYEFEKTIPTLWTHVRGIVALTSSYAVADLPVIQNSWKSIPSTSQKTMPWRTCHPTRVNHIISATVRLLAQTRRFIFIFDSLE